LLALDAAVSNIKHFQLVMEVIDFQIYLQNLNSV